MIEITFIAREAEEGGYYARAFGASIFTQAETLQELHLMMEDAIECHNDETIQPPQTFNVVLKEA